MSAIRRCGPGRSPKSTVPIIPSLRQRTQSEVLDGMRKHVDRYKYADGSFSLMPADYVTMINQISHDHLIYVSAGRWIESILARAAHHIDDCIAERKLIDFDMTELSMAVIQLPVLDLLRLIEKVKQAGLKPETWNSIRAGGDTKRAKLKAEGTRALQPLIGAAAQCLNTGASIITIESEGVTENANPWRADVAAKVINEVDMENAMFEATDTAVFEWYIENYGIHVSLFVDHSQIAQLERLRRSIWGTKDTFGQITSHQRSSLRSRRARYSLKEAKS